MDSIIKKLACARHPNEVVTQICTLPECQASSVLFCSKCQSSESAHYNQHKKNIVKIKDFLEAQVYAVDPPLVDELTQKVNELEQKLKKADDEYKKEDSQIDKDFGSLFAIFFKVTETGKTMLKTALREVFTKLVERNTAIRKNLESYKTNKVDLNELKKDLGQVTKDNAEDFFKGILGRRYQKYDVLKGNLSDLAAELEVGVKERPNYKKIPANQTQFEELKQDFEKACYNMINHLRNFVEIYGAKPVPVKKIDLSSLGKNQQAAAEPVHNASVARIAQDIERSNRNIFSKNPSMSQSQLVMSRDTSRTSIDFENLSPSKKFRSIAGFPEITNPKVVEVITKHLKVNYPENLQDEFIDFQTPLRNYKCLELPDVSVYQGQWRNNKRHGLGRIIYIDGGIYEGTWVDDVPSGFGRVIRRNGEMYEGDIKEYKAHGTGTYATLEGYRYSGGWVEDKKHGQGEEYKENSMFMYRGEFANNVYHGQGLLKLEDGRVFEGTFVDGKFTGKGSYFGPSSDEVQERYEGDFVDWKKHGKGVFELGDGSKYEGDFVNDLPEGYGEFTWPDGTISRGLWKNGKQDGVGEEISSSGTKREGEWVDGKWKRWIS